MIRNTQLRCRSSLPVIYSCVRCRLDFAPALTTRLDASALKFGHEHRSNPSVIPCLCHCHMGIDLGPDFGKPRPHPRPFTSSIARQLCQNFSHIVVCRFFLGFVGKRVLSLRQRGLTGIAEAAFYPGAIYYLSRWYTSKEVGFRIAMYGFGCVASRPLDLLFDRLNVGNMMAQGLGGLTAAGVLSGLEGAKGIRGWRWVRSFRCLDGRRFIVYIAFHHRGFHHRRLRVSRPPHPSRLPIEVSFMFVQRFGTELSWLHAARNGSRRENSVLLRADL